MWDFIDITYPKAAKPYRCEECRCEIAKGEKHSYTAGKVEGYFESYRLCMACADLAAAYCREFDDEGFPLGYMRQTLREEGVTDIDAWLAASKARAVEEQTRRAAERARVEAHAETTICTRCGATLATYSAQCSAALDDRCPGFETIERALQANETRP